MELNSQLWEGKTFYFTAILKKDKLRPLFESLLVLIKKTKQKDFPTWS